MVCACLPHIVDNDELEFAAVLEHRAASTVQSAFDHEKHSVVRNRVCKSGLSWRHQNPALPQAIGPLLQQVIIGILTETINVFFFGLVVLDH